MINKLSIVGFKALRDVTLTLRPFNVILGPNGSGKSTLLQALGLLADSWNGSYSEVLSVGLSPDTLIQVEALLSLGEQQTVFRIKWKGNRAFREFEEGPTDGNSPFDRLLKRIRVFSLHSEHIIAPVPLKPQIELSPTGQGLAGVLDQLRDQAPERFELLNDELGRFLPEFDRILFQTAANGARMFLLRTREGQHAIPACQLSQGTVLALTLLTLAYLPEPPSVIGLEEPDRGLHPRLLSKLRDILYRLSFPEDHGENRDPVQVVVTTHSPYFLDLYRDHPEEILIAQKEGLSVTFDRLSDRPDIEEILGDAPLGDVWYTGILGGVPAHT